MLSSKFRCQDAGLRDVSYLQIVCLIGMGLDDVWRSGLYAAVPNFRHLRNCLPTLAYVDVSIESKIAGSCPGLRDNAASSCSKSARSANSERSRSLCFWSIDGNGCRRFAASNRSRADRTCACVLRVAGCLHGRTRLRTIVRHQGAYLRAQSMAM